MRECLLWAKWVKFVNLSEILLIDNLGDIADRVASIGGCESEVRAGEGPVSVAMFFV